MFTRIVFILALALAAAISTSAAILPGPAAVRAAGAARGLQPCGAGSNVSRNSPRVIHTRQPLGVVAGGKYAYILNSGYAGLYGKHICRSSLTTIDASTGSVLRTRGLTETPSSIAVDSRHGHVFVVSYKDPQHPDGSTGYLDVFNSDGAGTRGGGAVDAGVAPQLLVDGASRRLYIHSAGMVTVYDTVTIRAITTTVIPGDLNVKPVVDEKRGRLYVLTDGGVAGINAGTGVLAGTVSVGQRPENMALDPKTGRLFVTTAAECRSTSAEKPAVLVVLNTANNAVTRGPIGSCTGLTPPIVDAPAGRVLVGAQGTNPNVEYSVLDALTGRVLRRLSSAPLLYWTIDPRTGRIYAAAQTCSGRPARCGDAVRVLDPRGWRLVRTIKVAHSWQGSLTVSGRKVFVTSPYFDMVTVLQTG